MTDNDLLKRIEKKIDCLISPRLNLHESQKFLGIGRTKFNELIDYFGVKFFLRTDLQKFLER